MVPMPSPQRQQLRMRGTSGVLAACLVLLSGCEHPQKTRPPVQRPVGSPAELVQALADAYGTRDYSKFEALLPAAGQPEYLFVLNEPDSATGVSQWGRTEELRIHQRMFEPQSTPSDVPPVPQDLWLDSIDITLMALTDFRERTDLYRSESNPGGLDPGLWRATEAVYKAHVLWDTQGELDYLIQGRENLIVIEDLQKQIGDAGKFFLFRWEDLGPGLKAATTLRPAAVLPRVWSRLKALYR